MRRIAFTLLALLAACGGGSDGRDSDGRIRPPPIVVIAYASLPEGVNGNSYGGLVHINDTFAGFEESAQASLAKLIVHELWHEYVSLDHLPEGCYANAYMSVIFDQPFCDEEIERWLRVPAGTYTIRCSPPELDAVAQVATDLISRETGGALTFHHE